MKLEAIKQGFKKEKFVIFWFSIGYIFTILEAFYGTFCDEADVITASWLMSQGSRLYSDIFCHHMPVPYFFLEIFQTLYFPHFLLYISFQIIS